MNKIKKFILKIPYYVSIMLQLHSKAPTKEIKRLIEVFTLGLAFVTPLTLLSGQKIFFIIQLPKIEYIDNYGSFMFFIFCVVYVFVFFDVKKCKEITAKNNQKHEKS
jgi:hypothetical protein